jgi:nicotinamide mononucleotide transporter
MEDDFTSINFPCMSLFDINTIFFEFVGYSMSYLEFFGVLFGLLAIYLSAKGNVLTWPVGLVNVVLAFLLYYQIRLYPDMLLQLFFLFTNVIGWWRWTHPHEREMDANNQLRVSFMSRLDVIMLIC